MVLCIDKEEILINWITNWAEGIIVAVIIGTIIEMILPNGKSKKYIKVVIGIYILNMIISPVISKITGNSLEISSSEVKSFLESDSKYVTSNLENTNDNNIEKIYKSKLEEDIKRKVQDKGYEVNKIVLQIELENHDEKEYGKIKNMQINLNKKISNETKENSVLINNIQIDFNNGTQQENLQNITEEEKKQLKEYIADTYEISEESIDINK